MKKLLLTGLVLTAVAGSAFAQKTEIKEAQKAFTLYSMMGSSKGADAAKNITQLTAGLQHAETATTNAATAQDPSAWAYRAAISASLAYADSLNMANVNKYADVAIQSINKTKQLDPKNTQKEVLADANKYLNAAYRTMGFKAYNSKDYKNATRAFEGLTKLNANDTAMYLNAGLTAKMDKDYPAMIRNYSKYVTYNTPSAKDVYSDLISVQMNEMKDTVGAMRLLDEAAAKYPDEVNFTAIRAQYYLNKGDDAKAEEMLGALVAKNPNNTAYNMALGNMYFNQAFKLQNQRQMIDIKKVKEFQAVTSKMNATLDKAIPYYKRAADADPKDAAALKMLKQIYTFKNDKASADAIGKKITAIK